MDWSNIAGLTGMGRRVRVKGTRAMVEKALGEYFDPYLQSDLASTKCIKGIALDGDDVRVKVVLGFPARGHAGALSRDLRARLLELDGIGSATVDVESKIVAHAVQQGVELLEEVKNVIAVASGKGGVGKSTVSANLALALSAEGATVGMLDADIYGPSQPRMLGARGKPNSPDGKSLDPVMSHRVQSMSIGYLIDEETPMIWRGPMVTQALEQLLKDTNWRGVDYLILDLPPGTGDTQLTLAQKIPVSGAVIVTTPQDIALLDARKGLKMFEKVKVPVLGVIENMSTHVCSRCGHEEHVFGHGGGARMASEHGVDLLGSLPLDIRIREDADGGHPTVAKDPEGRNAEIFREVARRVSAKLALKARDYRHAFPSIVIKN